MPTSAASESLPMIQRLPVSDRLTLVHDPSQKMGKTAGMAKGLFLSYQGELYAGESAGFGLPVWKTSQQTIFPTLVSAHWSERNVFEKVFRLDLELRWQLFGVMMPRTFSVVLEKLAKVYMKRPGQQQLFLKFRNALFGVMRIKSTMWPSDSQGDCRVTYRVDSGSLLITVDARSLQGDGTLILLNEVAGRPFSRLRNNEKIQEGQSIPAWQPCPFTAILENPTVGIGFSLRTAASQSCSDRHLDCGREVGRGLDWAGLELTAEKKYFSYGINFFEEQRQE